MTRCTFGLHRWVRAKPRADSGEAWTECALCGKRRGDGTLVSALIFLAVAAAALVVWAVWAPFLGAVMMVGAVLGLGWSTGPAVLEFFARWLSLGR
jgi:hypothetical protein